MIERFVDTSGWAEVADRTLLFHAQAAAACAEVSEQGGRLVTTSLVLAELTALLTSPLRMPKVQQIQLLDDLQADPLIEVVHVDPGLQNAAWHLWRSRLDKNWSLTDCVSFLVMHQRGITEAVTSDRHFEQAGFMRLLK
jgi:predicted nucleic acid-binding protein